MNAAVNLMSPRAQWHSRSQEIRRQWTLVFALLLAVLAMDWSVTWLRNRTPRAELAALEKSYQPLRGVSAENRTLAHQIADIQEQHKQFLAVIRQAPPGGFLEHLGAALVGSNQEAFLQEVTYQRASATSGSTEQQGSVLTLAGLSLHDTSIQEFADGLRRAMPTATIEVRGTQSLELGSQAVLSFEVHCSLPTEIEEE
jgi:hypothetical protein